MNFNESLTILLLLISMLICKTFKRPFHVSIFGTVLSDIIRTAILWRKKKCRNKKKSTSDICKRYQTNIPESLILAYNKLITRKLPTSSERAVGGKRLQITFLNLEKHALNALTLLREVMCKRWTYECINVCVIYIGLVITCWRYVDQ